MAEASLPTTAMAEPDAVQVSVRRAFGMSVGAVVTGVAVLVAVGLLSASSGAAGLPVGGVFGALFDWIPLVGVESSLSVTQENILFEIRLPRFGGDWVWGRLLQLSLGLYQKLQGFRIVLALPPRR